jgi:dihydroorotate dehydrogenase
MVKVLATLRQKNDLSYQIFGVGGVTTAEDYMDYKNAGADAVMSATGSMWNPYLAQEIKKDNGV